MALELSFSRLRTLTSLCLLTAVCTVVQTAQQGTQALASVPHRPAKHTPAAPPGPGPVDRSLPASAGANRGLPAGQRPPVVPPGTAAAAPSQRLSAAQWAQVPKPAGAGVRPAGGPGPSTAGSQNLLLRSGFALGDTSLVLYFDAAAPGVSSWSSWVATVYDPDTGSAQQSKPMSAADATSCATPRQYCRSLGAADGWSLVGDHPYFVTITVTLTDGSQAVSQPSGQSKARTTAVPPALPAQQAAGCACGNALYPTTYGQAVRGAGVNTGTGAFALSWTDLKLAGFGIPFTAVRRYSSTNTTAGSLGVGWTWTYDMRVIPPAGAETSVTVRAEDGAQVVYARNADGSYTRPPGVRSNLLATPDGWRLVTPDQITYAFDQNGRLTSARNSRGLGIAISYTATGWTITDAAGHQVRVDLGADGLVQRITLPDGRNVRYQYRNGLLSAATDAGGATWTYAYDGTLLAKLVDPHRRPQITNVYSGGRVSRQTDAAGAVITFAWDAGKQEARTVDADGVSYFDGYRGNVLVYSQNGDGDTVNQRYDDQVDPNLLVDAKGNQVASGFDRAGNVTSVTAPEPYSYTVSNSYDPHNNLTSHTDGLGHTATFGYTAADELRLITDPGGDQTELRVDDRGLVTAEVDPRGKVTTMDYDAAGNLVALTTPLGEKTTYRYDSTGRAVSYVDPRGNLPGAKPVDFTTSFAYDNLDRLRKSLQPGKQRPSETVYDDLGQLVKTVNPLAEATTYCYGPVIGRTTSIVDANGNTTSYTYTRAGRRASVTDPLGDKTTLGYDNRGNLSTVVSPRGNVKGANPALFTTSYTYDFNNNRVRVSRPYPGGGFTSRDARFDELNRPTATIDELGKTSTTNYDNNGNMVSTVDPLGRSTGIGYDANGRPNVVTAPAGGTAKTEYDEAGHPVKATSATGGVVTWTYDDDGNVTSMVEPRGNVSGANPADFTTGYAYDAARNLTAVTNPLGQSTRFAYDADNRVTATTDANGHATRYEHDDADRVITVTGPDAPSPKTLGPSHHDPEPIVTRYVYDDVGHLVARTDPNGHTSRYGHDQAGRLSSVTDPIGRQTTYRYDAEANLTQVVTPGPGEDAARSIVYTYDILGRKVGADLAHGGTIYAYGYDAKNRPTSLADPSGLRSQVYDDANRLTRVSRGDGQTFGYGYDADGNVTSRQWPDGTQVTAGFDASDRMTSLTAQGGVAGGQAAAYTFGYDPSGRLTQTTYPSSTGLVSDRGYDRAGRLADLNTHGTAGSVARYQITRDPVGNPTAIVTGRGDRSQTVGYRYDAADRLTSACVAAPVCGADATGKIAYTYDPVGNRLTQTLSGSAGTGTTGYRYDDADQLTEAILSGPRNNSDTSVKFGYDGQGNQVRAGGDSFVYNLDRTLASATVSGSTSSYSYDAQGLQLSAVGGSGTGVTSRTTMTDVNAPLARRSLETTASAGNSTSRGFLVGPNNTPLALLSGDQSRSFVPDWVGGVADVVSGQGASQASYDYDPFGNPRGDGTAAGAGGTDNPVRFAGGYQDATLGARYSYPARVYDPSTGRFGGLDPVASPLGAPASSSYAYVGNKPTVFRDPSGAIGGDPDHDAAEALALRQLDALYGVFHVYADGVPGRQTLMGRPGTGPNQTICVPNPNPPPGRSCPDIIVGTPSFTYVYEVKPATDQLSSIKPSLPPRAQANAAQVQRYVSSLSNAGYPNVQTGPDIAPDTDTMSDGSTLTIFAGKDWAQHARKGARPASQANASGIIYYQKTPPRVPVPVPNPASTQQPTSAPTEAPTEQPTTQPVDSPVTDNVLVDVLAAVAIVAIVVIIVIVAIPVIAAGVALLALF